MFLNLLRSLPNNLTKKTQRCWWAKPPMKSHPVLQKWPTCGLIHDPAGCATLSPLLRQEDSWQQHHVEIFYVRLLGSCTKIHMEGRVCPLSHFSRVRLFATLWTVAPQAPLSMGFTRQEHWSGLPCPPPGDLPSPGIESMSPRLLHCRQILYCWAIREVRMERQLCLKSLKPGWISPTGVDAKFTHTNLAGFLSLNNLCDETSGVFPSSPSPTIKYTPCSPSILFLPRYIFNWPS